MGGIGAVFTLGEDDDDVADAVRDYLLARPPRIHRILDMEISYQGSQYFRSAIGRVVLVIYGR